MNGENGIIGQAGNSKIETEKSEIKEQIDVMTVQSLDKVGNIDKEVLKDKLNTLPDGKEIIDAEDIIYVVYPKYTFEIDTESGNTVAVEIEKTTDETPWKLVGEGTEANPYLIESIEDLVAFSNSVNSGTSYIGKYVMLTRTIDFKSPFSYNNYKTKVSEKTNRIITEDESGTEIMTFLTSGTGFNPIGIDYTYAFRGVFDGNKCEVKNIFINREDDQGVGLFGMTFAQKIKNIGITGNIIGGYEVAGIVGRGQTVVYIENSYNKANIVGKRDVGGILGCMGNAINCYNTGNIKILGVPNWQSSADQAGGIAGDGASIMNCYNLGTIKLEIAGGYIAGIIGTTGENIFKCVNIGKLVTDEGISSHFMGGIIARSGSSIEECYNFGELSFYNARNDGAILAENTDAEVLNCYYKKGTASGGICGQDIEGKAEALEESQMPSVIEIIQNQIEIDGQMINVWKEDTNNINNGYPILYWQ